MYKRSQQGWIKHLDFIVLDMLCGQIALMISHQLRQDAWVYGSSLYRMIALWMAVFSFLAASLFNTMHNVLRRGYLKEFGSTFYQCTVVFLGTVAMTFSVKEMQTTSRLVLWGAYGLYILFAYSARLLWRGFLFKHPIKNAQRAMLVVADLENAPEVISRLQAARVENIRVVGAVLTEKAESGTEIEGIPVVAELQDAADYICREWIDEVYIACKALPEKLLEDCSEMGVTVHQELTFQHSTRHRAVERVAGATVLTSSMIIITPAQQLIKRAVDILGGLVGSVITLVILAIVGPKIKKASPGPILFAQERIGQNGKRFKMYKIRSMYPDAEKRKAELLEQNRNQDGMMFKLDFDPRIIGNEILPDGTHKTGIGEFIRRTSLDEFPQFFNCLMGQMSLVGTRPPTVDEWEKYQYHHRARLSVKPGLTGMWQVSGRSDITDFEEVVRLDTEYINNWSFGMDARILLKTIRSVLNKEGSL